MNENKKQAFGTVQFGFDYNINYKIGREKNKGISCILEKTFQFGILFLDTLHAYGQRKQVLGEFLLKSTFFLNHFQNILKEEIEMISDLLKKYDWLQGKNTLNQKVHLYE